MGEELNGPDDPLAFPVGYAIFGTMAQAKRILNPVVAATLTLTSIMAPAAMAVPVSAALSAAFVTAFLARPAGAQATDLATLLDELADPQQERWMRIERQILREWGQSGSATIDYLVQRGQEALQAGQAETAISHFSAVIDYAPDFAEAWNGRATAYFLANRLGQSLSDIEQVLRLNPHHFGALAGLGQIMEQLERDQDALRAYRASLAIHPHQQGVIDAMRRLELASEGQAL